MARLTATILGCGSSGGVPRIGGHWGDCDPDNPRNTRRRCSLLLEREGPGGTTTVLIDTTPDLRAQLLGTGTSRLDGVVYTHSHADHMHGIDDLRMVVINMRQRVRVWAEPATQDALISRFGYCFVQPEGSDYPPILEMNTLDGPVSIDGPGGTITLAPFEVDHRSVPTIGLRIGPLAYSPDVRHMTPEAWAAVEGLECWILDALRRTPHPTHVHLSEALEWFERARPAQGVLTNMHIDLDYDTVEAETPEYVTPAFDGMRMTFEI